MRKKKAFHPLNAQGNIFGSIVVLLFIITLIGMSALLYWEKEKLSQSYGLEREAAQKEQKIIKEELYKKTIDLEKATEKIILVEKQYSDIDARYKKLEQDYAAMVDSRKFIAEQFTQLQKENGKYFENITLLTNKLDKQIEQLSTVSNDLAEESKKKAKGGFLSRKEEVEIPAVVIKDDTKIRTPEPTPVPSPSEDAISASPRLLQDAQVMSVNQEHNFVVLNKGLVDGIKVGELYSINRASKEIARMKISEIRDFVSLGIIEKDYQINVVKEGDKIAKIST
jgi:hypothetical protein